VEVWRARLAPLLLLLLMLLLLAQVSVAPLAPLLLVEAEEVCWGSLGLYSCDLYCS
jgi:hypothetical protein